MGLRVSAQLPAPHSWLACVAFTPQPPPACLLLPACCRCRRCCCRLALCFPTPAPPPRPRHRMPCCCLLRASSNPALPHSTHPTATATHPFSPAQGRPAGAAGQVGAPPGGQGQDRPLDQAGLQHDLARAGRRSAAHPVSHRWEGGRLGREEVSCCWAVENGAKGQRQRATACQLHPSSPVCLLAVAPTSHT